MKAKLETTVEGLIIIYPSIIQSMRRTNSAEGAKTLGAPIILDSEHICFLAFNNDGYITFFMSNGFEISLKINHDEAKNAYNFAKMKALHVIE
jgi:hypothetical protein